MIPWRIAGSGEGSPMKFAKILVVNLTLLLATATSAATHADNAAESSRQFVQAFLDWYVPKLGSGNPTQMAVEQRGDDFNPNLLKALKEDLAASAKSPDEIVGLDFDPFLNSQDPGDKYSTGAGTTNGKFTSVPIYRVMSGKRAAVASGFAVLERVDDRWRFANFAYPKIGNLMKVLAQLKADRALPR
jgi:hypothetical protein